MTHHHHPENFQLARLIELAERNVRQNLIQIEQNNHIIRLLRAIALEERPSVPTSITFTQQGDPMLPPVAGNTLVYTGTLAPAGAVFPSDSVFAVTSSDPTVTPTVDATGLIVTIPLPSTFVDSAASPFTVNYTATSASTSMSLAASIVPSVPAVVPTGITFTQTT